MRISDIFGMSVSNLWRRKMRTFLTVLGVIIGTASIVVMLSLGFGLREATMKEVETAGGLTEIMVYSDEYGSDELLLDDTTIDTFMNLDYVEGVEPILTFSMPIQAGVYEGYFDILGVFEEYMRNIELGEGTAPKAGGILTLVAGNQVLMDFMNAATGEWVDYETMDVPDIDLMNTNLIGGLEVEDIYEEETVAEPDSSTEYYDSTFSVDGEDDYDDSSDMFDDEETYEETEDGSLTDEFIGDEWNTSSSYSYFSPDTKRVQLKVSGITEGDYDTSTEYSYNFYADMDALKDFLRKNYSENSVIPGQPTDREGKPYRDLKYSTLIVNVDAAENVEEVLDTIQEMGYYAEANKEWLEQTEREFIIIEAVLGGIGAVAMLVAAISIANTMTMSIYERTREIGIMKVLGCSLGNIRSMFLTEAAFIGFIGGVIGIVLSYILSLLVNYFISPIIMEDYGMGTTNISMIPPWLILAAIGFSTIIGMVAGFFPAQRATRLSPLAAIRNE